MKKKHAATLGAAYQSIPSAGERQRNQAEVKLTERKKKAASLPAAKSDPKRLVHELEVHQIELEMQNEELRRSQEELEASHARYFDLFDLAPVGYFTLSETGIVLDLNLTAANLLGFEKSKLIKKPINRFVVKEDQDIYYLLQRQIFETRARQACELQMKREGGVPFWSRIEGIAAQGSDGVLVFRATLSDISEHKRAEKLLRESEEKYRGIFENVQDLYYETSFDGTLLEISPSIELISRGQYRREDLIGKSMYEFYSTGADRDALVAALKQKGIVNDCEVRLKNRDGSSINCSISSKIKCDAEGRPEKIIGSMHDITERKRAEEELQFRNLILTTQQEAAIDGILVVDEASKIVSYNRRFMEMWGVSQEVLEDEDGSPLLISNMGKVSDPETFLLRVQDIYEHRQEIGRDEIVMKDRRVFDRYSAPMVGQDGRYFGRVWYFRDITGRKKAEEQIRNDLKVKDVMLKEIHHRVRNNLNVITSLLSLQSGRITTKRQALEGFEESKNRIYAMALVHANLYNEEDYSRVDLASFVKNLAQNLSLIYKADVQMDVQVEALSLDLNNAVPCGLILNELVTNALRHAFHGRREGLITIRFRTLRDQSHELTVRDNGTGIPKEINVRNAKSLGLVIVNQLITQIDGVLKTSRDKGTRFQITFPVSGA
jgi:PAS domain S-box-containing protein